MSTTKTPIKRDSLVLYVAIAFIVGFVAGATFAVYKMGPAPPSATPSANVQDNAVSDQQTQAITHLEADVTTNPDNFQAWTQLGNLYYDTGQYEKAVKAYEKSLTLHSGTGDLWTDLGVMYRRTQRPEKAIEAFNKAVEIDPKHEIARLNKGIVLLYDLNDSDAAIASWEELLRINPEARTGSGELIRDFVDHIRQDLASKKK